MGDAWSTTYETDDIKDVASMLAESFTFAFNGNVATNLKELEAMIKPLIAMSPSHPNRWNYYDNICEGKHGEVKWTLLTKFNSGKYNTVSGRTQYVLNEEGKVILCAARCSAVEFANWAAMCQETA